MVRKLEDTAKNTMVSRDASCVKEWFLSCLPKDPILNLARLGSSDL